MVWTTFCWWRSVVFPSQFDSASYHPWTTLSSGPKKGHTGTTVWDAPFRAAHPPYYFSGQSVCCVDRPTTIFTPFTATTKLCGPCIDRHVRIAFLMGFYFSMISCEKMRQTSCYTNDIHNVCFWLLSVLHNDTRSYSNLYFGGINSEVVIRVFVGTDFVCLAWPQCVSCPANLKSVTGAQILTYSDATWLYTG